MAVLGTAESGPGPFISYIYHRGFETSFIKSMTFCLHFFSLWSTINTLTNCIIKSDYQIDSLGSGLFSNELKLNSNFSPE